ncbi:MAG: hypothetical protein V1850_03065, partial [Candidatus Bathyarchaeota archaeon]
RASPFLVLLTDPPTVPAGTTLLNLTYSDVSLHVTFTNGTAKWLPLSASGTVNLFSLINMSKTIASTTIPIGSAVDKIQFTIADVDAVVNGVTYNVTALSSTLIVKVANSKINQTLSGVLIDFNPTLVQIRATDANGNLVNYYVLVPSATAAIIGDLREEHLKVGTIVKLGENNRAKLVHVEEEFSSSATIVSASLSLNGNLTTLSVTLKNEGNYAFRVFGLTLHGEFNATRTWEKDKDANSKYVVERIHPETIPFKLNNSALIPLLGNKQENDGEHERDNVLLGNIQRNDIDEDVKLSSLTLQAGQTVTLTFSDVIALQPGKDSKEHPPMVVTPILGADYTLKLMGEGFKTFRVTATP